MGKIHTIQAVLSLSSGVVSKLCGSCRYADIDAYTERWVRWVESQPDTVRFETWQDAYFAFAGISG